MISLLLVEDHAIFAEALVRMLRGKEDLDVVKVVDTAEEALQALPDLVIDLALVDVSLPSMSGIELVGELRQTYPEVPCLMISGHLSGSYVRRSLQAGARGYAIKDSAAGIIEGIRRVLDGEIYVSEELHSFNRP
jgi:DNA-binding NarL/FixJ family response regulator